MISDVFFLLCSSDKYEDLIMDNFILNKVLIIRRSSFTFNDSYYVECQVDAESYCLVIVDDTVHSEINYNYCCNK